MGTTVNELVKKDEDDIQMSFSFLWMIDNIIAAAALSSLDYFYHRRIIVNFLITDPFVRVCGRRAFFCERLLM